MAASPRFTLVAEARLARISTWLVDDDPEFRVLAADIAHHIGLAILPLTVDEAASRVGGGETPRAVAVDGASFLPRNGRAATDHGADSTNGAPPDAGSPTRAHASAPRYLELAHRVLVCTAYLPEDLDADRLGDPRIRLLHKPFDLDDFESALRWLDAGVHPGLPERAGSGERSRP